VCDPLQFVEVADGAVLFAVFEDELGQVGIDVRVRDQFLIRSCVDVQLLDFLFVDVQVGLQLGRVDVLHDIDLLQLAETVQAAELVAIFDELGGSFASELRDGEQIVGVAAVEVNLDNVVHRFALLLLEGRERVGAHARSVAERLLPAGSDGVCQPLLFLRKLLELSLVKAEIKGRLLAVVVPEIVDVARDHDGEQEEGGRPFASGEMEFRFHSCKDTTWEWGLSIGL